MALYNDDTFFPGCANPRPPYFLTAYEIAVKHGFQGTEEEWLESLTAFQMAKDAGFDGTFEEWVQLLANPGSGTGGGASTEKDEEGNDHVSGGGDTIVNVGTPEKDTDAANKGYVDTVVKTEVVEKVIYVETREDGSKVEHVTGGNETIVDVATPEKPTDAANKEYVDTVVKTEVVEKVIYVETKEDGSEVEHISGGGTTIVNVAAPVENTDAVNKAYADAIKKIAEAAVKRAGDTMEGVFNFGGFQGKGVAAPTEGTDVVNKDYADAIGVCRDTLLVNDDLATEYAAQTVSVSMESYDDAHVEMATDCGDTYGVFYNAELVKDPVGKQIVVYKTLAYGETVTQVFRIFTFTSAGINVGDCYAYNTDGSITKTNKALIPTRIEGIKYGEGGGSGAPSAEGVLF